MLSLQEMIIAFIWTNLYNKFNKATQLPEISRQQVQKLTPPSI